MADGHCYWCSCDLSKNGWCSRRCITHHKTQDPENYKKRIDKINKDNEPYGVKGLTVMAIVVLFLVYGFWLAVKEFKI